MYNAVCFEIFHKSIDHKTQRIKTVTHQTEEQLIFASHQRDVLLANKK